MPSEVGLRPIFGNRFGNNLRLASQSDLWRLPPWAQVKPSGGYQMGLAPESLARWLPQRASAAEYERKVGLMNLSQLPEQVYQSLPKSAAAERLAAKFVMAHLVQQQKQSQQQGASPALRLRPDLPPLVESALQIPDDLCLLQLNEQTQEFCLIAASLCSPSYWSLSEKLGLPLSAIHGPVPGLNAQLGPRMQRFFSQMPEQRCFVRRNFFVHAAQDLYQPQPDATHYGQVSCRDLLLRCERQSLVRLNQHLVLFSIRVDLAPLADARHWPTQALNLHRLLSNFSDAQREAFGGSLKLNAVLGFLASHTASGVEP